MASEVLPSGGLARDVVEEGVESGALGGALPAGVLGAPYAPVTAPVPVEIHGPSEAGDGARRSPRLRPGPLLAASRLVEEGGAVGGDKESPVRRAISASRAAPRAPSRRAVGPSPLRDEAANDVPPCVSVRDAPAPPEGDAAP